MKGQSGLPPVTHRGKQQNSMIKNHDYMSRSIETIYTEYSGVLMYKRSSYMG